MTTREKVQPPFFRSFGIDIYSSPTSSPQPVADSPSPKTLSPISLPPSPLDAPMNAPSFFISDATAIISVSISVGRQHTSSSFSSVVESEPRQPQQPQRRRSRDLCSNQQFQKADMPNWRSFDVGRRVMGSEVFRFAFAIVSCETVNNW
ncbi:H3-K4 specific histone methyltransferase, partial [Prunus dulcis]